MGFSISELSSKQTQRATMRLATSKSFLIELLPAIPTDLLYMGPYMTLFPCT